MGRAAVSRDLCPLDELEDRLLAAYGTDKKHGRLPKTTLRAIFGSFRDAHPGLEDETVQCEVCGKPIAGGMYVDGFPYSKYRNICEACFGAGK
jgi:hypothetical protein